MPNPSPTESMFQTALPQGRDSFDRINWEDLGITFPREIWPEIR